MVVSLPGKATTFNQPANILIIEPSLKGYVGHCHNDLLIFERMISKAGLNSTALISRAALPEILNEHRAVGVFINNPFQRRTRPGLAGFLKITGALYLSLAAYLRRQPVTYDCVVLRTASQELLAVIADLVRARLLPSHVRVMAWLLFEPAWNTRPMNRYRARHQAEYRRALRRLETHLDHKSQISLFSEIKELGELYAELLQRPVDLCEVPNLASRPIKSNRRSAEAPARIMMLGNAARDKGYDLLADAIRHLRSRNIPAEFHIHAASDRTDLSSLPACFAQLQAIQPPIHFSNASLDEAQYFEWLNRADLLLLPYRLPDYAKRGSGIHNQASMLGIPMVVPAQAEFAAEAVEDGRAVAMVEHSSLSLADAIEGALVDLEGLQSRALQAAKHKSRHAAVHRIEGLFLEIARHGNGPKPSRRLHHKIFDAYRSLAAIICAPTWLKSSAHEFASKRVPSPGAVATGQAGDSSVSENRN